MRTYTDKNADFLILTETKIDPASMAKKIKMNGLEASVFSLSPHARAGVVIYSQRKHRIREHSTRTSREPGYFAMAVYNMAGEAVVVVGIYGKPENNDLASASLLEEMEQAIQELQHLYGARNVIIAGDFNVTRHIDDASSGTVHKPRAAQKLNSLIDTLNLQDLDEEFMQPVAPRHTWYKPNDPNCSSRLDYILTSFPIVELQVELTPSIYDHEQLKAAFGHSRRHGPMTMRDTVLAKDEFTIRAMENIQCMLLALSQEHGHLSKAEIESMA